MPILKPFDLISHIPSLRIPDIPVNLYRCINSHKQLQPLFKLCENDLHFQDTLQLHLFSINFDNSQLNS